MSITEITTTAAPGDIEPAKRARERRIPKRIVQAVKLLASGECKTQKAAAERVGVTEQHLSRMLNRAEIQAFCSREAARMISSGVFRASTRFIELVDAESEHVAAKVSDRILVHAGILKPEQSGSGVNVSVGIVNNVSPGYVIDLSEPVTVNATLAVKET